MKSEGQPGPRSYRVLPVTVRILALFCEMGSHWRVLSRATARSYVVF